MDKKAAGVVQGAGTTKKHGKIHWTDIEVHGITIPCVFTVTDIGDQAMILGFDFLVKKFFFNTCCADACLVGKGEVLLEYIQAGTAS